MSQMVERVRVAIASSARDCGVSCSGWEPVARAAIAAMREPTASMNAEGDAKMDHPLDYDACDVWEAMVDAALAEKVSK